MTDKTYTNERIVGHHIEAELETSELFSGKEMERIRITQNDVGWDEPKFVRLTREELQEIAEVFAE